MYEVKVITNRLMSNEGGYMLRDAGMYKNNDYSYFEHIPCVLLELEVIPDLLRDALELPFMSDETRQLITAYLEGDDNIWFDFLTDLRAWCGDIMDWQRDAIVDNSITVTANGTDIEGTEFDLILSFADRVEMTRQINDQLITAIGKSADDLLHEAYDFVYGKKG